MHYVSTPSAHSLDAKAVAATAAGAFSVSGAPSAAGTGVLSSRELRQIIADLIG